MSYSFLRFEPVTLNYTSLTSQWIESEYCITSGNHLPTSQANLLSAPVMAISCQDSPVVQRREPACPSAGDVGLGRPHLPGTTKPERHGPGACAPQGPGATAADACAPRARALEGEAHAPGESTHHPRRPQQTQRRHKQGARGPAARP